MKKYLKMMKWSKEIAKIMIMIVVYQMKLRENKQLEFWKINDYAYTIILVLLIKKVDIWNIFSFLIKEWSFIIWTQNQYYLIF